MPDYTAFYTAMAWDKFNNEKEKANIKEEKDMYDNSIPTQNASVYEEPIKNKKSQTIKELLEEQSSIVKDIRIYVDQIAVNIDLFCGERPMDNNKIDVHDLTTAILSNNETLYQIRAKLGDLSGKLG